MAPGTELGSSQNFPPSLHAGTDKETTGIFSAALGSSELGSVTGVVAQFLGCVSSFCQVPRGGVRDLPFQYNHIHFCVLYQNTATTVKKLSYMRTTKDSYFQHQARLHLFM